MQSLVVCVLFMAAGVMGGGKVLQDEMKLRGAESRVRLSENLLRKMLTFGLVY